MLRPDERANAAEIERDKNIRKNISTGAKTAIGVGTALASSSIAPRVMSFLNEYISPDLAMKGISKISPELGSFLNRGVKAGLNLEDGLEFIKEKMTDKQEPPKESRNIIQQYSPELHQFIDQEVRKGRKPIEAGAIAQADKRFKDIISKLTKDHQTPWSNILESVYGGGEQALPPQNPQQPQQQSGQGQQALMAILQKIQQSRGG